jgi:hypothetical protein
MLPFARSLSADSWPLWFTLRRYSMQESTIAMKNNDCESEFRYLLDGITWQNDRQADKYVSNVYGSENSVAFV